LETVGHFGRFASEKAGNRRSTSLGRRVGSEIGDSGQSDDTVQGQRTITAQTIVDIKPFAPGQPQRQVSTSRVTYGGRTIKIELALSRDLEQVIGRIRDILEGARPPTTLVAHPPVLDAPGRDACIGKGVGEPRDVAKIVLCEPAASVDHDHDRVRTVSVGQAQLTELEWILTVGQAMIGFRLRQGKGIGGAHYGFVFTHRTATGHSYK
jgi:hypothetical protein